MCILSNTPVPTMDDINQEEIDFGMINNIIENDDQLNERNSNSELLESKIIRNNIARCLYNR